MAASKSEDNAAAAAVAVPWLDLPEGLTEKILGRLPVHDYVRFGAVCRRWLSIQRDHRLRHSPSSPPTVKIPWFIPYRPREESVVCTIGLLSAEERRLQVPITSTYLASLESRDAAMSEGRESPACSSSPYGWLLFDEWPFFFSHTRSYKFSLLNPITGVHTILPVTDDMCYGFKAAISPPPACDVFVLTRDYTGNKLHIYRRGNPDWTFVWYNRHDWGVFLAVASVIYYDGKFYCFRLGKDFMAFDIDSPDLMRGGYLPTEVQIEMDQSLLPKDDREWPDVIEDRLEVFLVESNGKMLLACKFFDSDPSRKTRILVRSDPSHETRTLVRFELFEADLSNRRWAKAECLGDQALIIYGKFAVSLTASDVGVKRNCIYVLDAPKTEEEPPAPWNMFDLSTGELADASLPVPPPPSTHLMFVPSIY